MSGISLTASMRSNLLSLQNISGQVSSTQNKLSTGNKVNSAIDNPSSYYTALSLNNRADDLNALLDSMGQAVSTIKAATMALESATEFLEQAKAVANQALETASVPSKSFFEKKVGENGAVVTTAQELRDAIAAGKETICVYGAIDLGDISASDGLTLQENQKLVGIGYFGNYDTDTNKFSSISATANTVKNLISITQNGCEVSDLSVSYENSAPSGSSFAIYVSGTNVEADIGDVDICAEFLSSVDNKAAISSQNGAIVNIKNNINIQTSGQSGHGIFAYNSGTINITGNIKIETRKYGLCLSVESGNTINILSTAHIYFNTVPAEIYNVYDGGQGSNILDIAAGAKLAFEKDGKVDWYEVKENYKDENTSATTANTITADNIKDKLNVETTSAWELPKKIEGDKEDITQDFGGNDNQYQEIINQYDALIKDAGYKGINLLQTDKLTVKFNEESTAALEVQGRDMSSKALGFKTFEWQTQGDINKSIEELSSAINAIRNYSSELGNNYNIITTRQDFTESLINVLTEGADKLTLADMNEESANMLALQTRQQLAVNSLSLASQASQSILKLF